MAENYSVLSIDAEEARPSLVPQLPSKHQIASGPTLTEKSLDLAEYRQSTLSKLHQELCSDHQLFDHDNSTEAIPATLATESQPEPLSRPNIKLQLPDQNLNFFQSKFNRQMTQAYEDSFDLNLRSRVEISRASDESPLKVSLCKDSFKSPMQEDSPES